MKKESKEIGDMSFEEFETMFPQNEKTATTEKKKTLFGAILKYPFKFFAAMFGIDKKTISSNAAKSSSNASRSYNEPSNSFRETYRTSERFNPYNYDFVSAQMYYKAIDGKGDSPEPCDCDHDR